MIWRTYVPVVLQRFIIHLGLLITIVKHLQIFQLFSKYSIWWYGGEGDLHVHVFFKLICIVSLMNRSYVYINLYMCVVFS